jgi:hypothetical protein
MKTKLSILLAVALCAGLFAGCKTVPPRTQVYHALSDTQIAVDAAMKVYGRAHATGKITDDTRAKVHDAHAKYRAAFDAALTIAEFDFGKPTPENVSSAATALLNIISQLNL